jgi:hypothetical protein
MTMNETQALKWLVIAVGAVSGAMMGATWAFLLRLRTQIRRKRHDREIRQERMNHPEGHTLMGVR